MVDKFQYLKSIFPGVALALIFCLFSQGINNILAIEIFGTEKSPISTVLIAILLGILMGNAFTPRPGMMIGLDFTQQYILKLGIIFLGIRLSFDDFVKFGSVAIPLVIFCILGVLGHDETASVPNGLGPQPISRTQEKINA